jgi:hypothetical protein
MPSPSAAQHLKAAVTHDPERLRRIGTALVAAGAVYLAAAAGMALVFASGPPSQLEGHLAELEQGFGLYRWGFVGASLLAPALITVLLLLVTAAGVPSDAVCRWIGTVLLAGYLPLATIAYSTQYMVLPGLLELDLDAAALWYFHDARSIPYALDLTGYAVLGLAAIVLAVPLRDRSRLLRWVAGWMVAMGLLSVTALVLHAVGASTAASVSSGASALCTLPIMALALVEGRRLRAGPSGTP